MTEPYFQRVIRQTPTRVWVNNPIGPELDLALAAGAICGTTNPMYCARLLKAEPEYIGSFLDQAIRESENDEVAADLTVQRVTARFMRAFLPLYEKSDGREGFVTIQDDPHKDDDPANIVNAALRHAKVGKNYMAKVPVTEVGMEAIADLIVRNIPVCATEVFAIAQAIAMCEVYEKTARKCGNRPPFFVTHITGIYDEELQAQVVRNNIAIAPRILQLAGCIVGRKQYRVLKQRGYHATMLGGGARGMHHFTEFVGGAMHITINWSTFGELLQADPPVVSRIEAADPAEWVEELSAKIPDFQAAYEEDGLAPSQFEGFAPLQRFRNNFIAGYDALLAAVAERRTALAVQ